MRRDAEVMSRASRRVQVTVPAAGARHRRRFALQPQNPVQPGTTSLLNKDECPSPIPLERSSPLDVPFEMYACFPAYLACSACQEPQSPSH
ncbi:hypothetical protein MSG28_002837 [Choristoneura fumiferana]|uniref:Uncharacterized protein n=1 Tax=Choristoneura fumiferana TaxID=7141 RepID=A0ACC0JJI0_CHOFU|nr:hypothetical protein MSG28_002837 [Choristoneura fumiferana]